MAEVGKRRVAVITGGSQGLGFAIAEALVRSGWSIVVDARRAERLAGAADLLGSGATVIAIAGDITDPAHRAALVDAASRLGRVDLLVNNASTLGRVPLEHILDLDPDVWRATFDVNVIAPFALASALEPLFAEGATILNITSDAAVEPYERWGGYGASKAALEHASRVLATERSDLRVLIVDPGDMRTEMHQAAFPGEDISDRPEPSVAVPGIVALVRGDQPSGRYLARSVPARDGSAA
jgi:NAD(P)-dependent dehydrogenase (short-subunit alcohol dehydrogenase family)